MLPKDFLDILCLSDFGKIICINLYRSARIATLSNSVVRDFLDSCVAEYQKRYGRTLSDPPKVVALGVATEWEVRSKLVADNLCPSPPGCPDPAQYAVIVPVDRVLKNAASTAPLTYVPRRISKQTDFDVLLTEWLKLRETWTLGFPKDYFWLARPVDHSRIEPQRLVKGLAQFHIENLGLCHFGKKHTLVRVLVPASMTGGKVQLCRPTALDGVANPAFRAATDTEVNAPSTQPGTTIDLRRVRSRARTIDGQNEWLCESMTVAATELFWEFLGEPVDDACIDDENLHSQVLKNLQKTTPLGDARSYLDSL